MPAMVGRVACQTPAAMPRGLPVPLMASTSNTATMPLTVPSKPSSGYIATRVLLRRSGPSRCCCAWASQALRTARCQLPVSSLSTCCQAWRRSQTHSGNTRRMYQKRSNTRVQNTTHSPANAHITTPPALMKSSNAWPLSTRRNHSASQSVTARRPGQVQGNKPGALLLQQLNQALAAARQQGVQEQQRNRHHQTQHRGHQRLRDTVGHQSRIAATALGNRLEGDDHPSHGAEQTKQWRHGAEQLEQALAFFQLRGFLEDRFVELQLQGFQIRQLRFRTQHADDPPQRVIGARRTQVMHLRADTTTHTGQVDHAPDRQQQTECAEHQNHPADQTTLLYAIPQARLALQLRQQGAAAWVNRQAGNCAAAVQIIRDLTQAGRLTRRRKQLAGIGVITQEGIGAVGGERADTQHILRITCAVDGNHRQLQLLNPATGGEVFEQQHPVAIEVGGRGQRTAFGQRFETRQALGVLGIEQAVLPLAGDITGALTDHTKQLAEVTGALAEEFFLFGEQSFLTVEFGLQLFGLGLLCGQGAARSGQQLGTLATFGNKGLLAALHGADFSRAFAANTLQQLIRAHRFGSASQGGQQGQGKSENATIHGLASSARVFTGRSSTAGACSWRAIAIAWRNGRRALPSRICQLRVCGFHQPLSWPSRVWKYSITRPSRRNSTLRDVPSLGSSPRQASRVRP